MTRSVLLVLCLAACGGADPAAADASSAVRVDDHTALVAVVRAGVAAIGAQLDTDPHALLRALVDGGAELDVAELVFASSDLRHAARHDDRARRARREAT